LRDQIPPTEQDDTYRMRLVQGEVQDENAAAMGGVAGHAGLFAPVLDVAIFAQCMLQGGAPILRRETVQLFTSRPTASSCLSDLGKSLTLVGSNSSDNHQATANALSATSDHKLLGWDVPTGASQSGRYFSARAFGHLGYSGTSLWIDPERSLTVVLLTNRTWPDRKSQLIKQLRTALHDAIVEALAMS